MGFSVAYSSPPMSEIEENTGYVQSYLETDEEQLTRLLKGMSGVEVNIYFRTDSAEIEWRERQKIHNVAKAMWVYPMMNVSLGGHADRRGSDGYNDKLTQKRIAAVNEVFKAVLSKKYNSKRFYTHGYGKQQALHKPGDEEGMSFDRRVSILVLIQQ